MLKMVTIDLNLTVPALAMGAYSTFDEIVSVASVGKKVVLWGKPEEKVTIYIIRRRKAMNRKLLLVYVIIILSLFTLNIISFAAVIIVPTDQPTIQAGIDAANNNDIVLVAEGIYRGEGNVNIDFKGKQITLKSINGAKATIIDCEEIPGYKRFYFQK